MTVPRDVGALAAAFLAAGIGCGGNGESAPDADADAVEDGSVEDGDAGEDATEEDADGSVEDASRRPHGDPCIANSDCIGSFCVTTDYDPAFVDGYCSAVMCDPARHGACGEGASCFDTEIFPPLCVRACEFDSECRPPDYVCIGSCVPAVFTATLDRPGTLDGSEADVAAAVAAVSDDRMMQRVRELDGEADALVGGGTVRIRSRATRHADHAVAAAWLVEQLEAAGLATRRLEFESGGVALVNIEAEIPGSEAALDPVLVTAHWDAIASETTGWDPATGVAPGAVDNGSGVVIALEAVSVLTAEGAAQPRRTVRIVLFDAEETGLLGSEDYVAGLESAGEATACTFNVDMVGWAHEAAQGRFWYLFSEGSRTFAALGIESMDLFAPDAAPIVSAYTGAGQSDHASFWAVDRCAVSMSSFPRMPTNHTVDDTADAFQPAFFHEVARAAVAVVAAWAYRS